MSRIILVRHAQASWGAADSDVLSDLGHRQGRVVGAALAARGVRPDVVVTGGLLRQTETADTLLETAGWDDAAYERVLDPGWDEYDHAVVAASPDTKDVGAQDFEARPSPVSSPCAEEARP